MSNNLYNDGQWFGEPVFEWNKHDRSKLPTSVIPRVLFTTPTTSNYLPTPHPGKQSLEFPHGLQSRNITSRPAYISSGSEADVSFTGVQSQKAPPRSHPELSSYTYIPRRTPTGEFQGPDYMVSSFSPSQFELPDLYDLPSSADLPYHVYQRPYKLFATPRRSQSSQNSPDSQSTTGSERSVNSTISTNSRSSTFSSLSANSSFSGSTRRYMLPEGCEEAPELSEDHIYSPHAYSATTELSQRQKMHMDATGYHCSYCEGQFDFDSKILFPTICMCSNDFKWRNNRVSDPAAPATRHSPSPGCSPPLRHGNLTPQQRNNNSLTLPPTLENWTYCLNNAKSFEKAGVVNRPELVKDTIVPFRHQLDREERNSLTLDLDWELSNPIKAIESTENKQVQIMLPEYIDPDDSGSSFSEYETDWEDDEMRDGLQDMDICGTSPTNGDTATTAYVISKVLSPMQHALVDRMMTEFWIIFKQEADIFQRDFPVDITSQDHCHEMLDSGDEPRGSKTEQSYSTLESSSSSRQTKNLGSKRNNVQQNNQDDRNDDRDLKRPRTLSSLPQDRDESAKFACPYRKHNPSKYGVRRWRSCALTAFETVARVKAHLYRYHRIFPCQRCKTQFKNQVQVNQHLREPEPCVLREIGHGEGDGLTGDIVERLKSKKKSEKNQSDGDRWKEIYRLLFPDEIVPSPYFEAVQENLTQSPDSRELANYEEFCRHALPHSVRAALEEIVRNESHPIEEILRNQLVTIIRDCQDKVFSKYRESTATNITSPIRTRLDSNESLVSHGPEVDNIAASNELVWHTPIPHPVPSFLQPPPPQNHLGSHQLNTTALKSSPGKPSSDSGYASNSSDLPHSSAPHDEQYSSQSTFEHPPLTAREPSKQQYPVVEPLLPTESALEQRVLAKGGSLWNPFEFPPPTAPRLKQLQYIDPALLSLAPTEPALEQPPLTDPKPDVGSFQLPSGDLSAGRFSSTIPSDTPGLFW